MTNAMLYTYKCKTCNEVVEYYVPIEQYWESDEYGATWRVTNPKNRRYHKHKARYIHNATHKGEIDKFI